MITGEYMQGITKKSSISHRLVLTGIWIINLLIVLFGLPFLLYKKVVEFCSNRSNKIKDQPNKKINSKAGGYLHQQIDPKM
jgi:hypothetical protein